MDRNEMIDVLKGNVKYIDAKACQEYLDEAAWTDAEKAAARQRMGISDAQLLAQRSNRYGITARNFDAAVKLAMCDGVGIADWISNMGSTDGSKPYDLYRCPWCGGFAIVIKEPMKPGHMKIYVKCTNCGAVHPHGTFSTYDSFVCSNEEAEDLAVDAWNTRYKFD